MDQLSQRIKQTTNELKDYFETKFELLVLNVSERVTLWIGETIQQLVAFTILGIGLLLGLFALGFYLGELFGSTALGFAVVSAPVLILGLILTIAKPKGIARNIQNQFMNDVLKALDDNKEKSDIKMLKENNQDKVGN